MSDRARLLCARSLVPSAVLGLAALCGTASAQSFGLDDWSAAAGIGVGGGAEDPYGIAGFSYAPSPSLTLGGFTDADILTGGPALHKSSPLGMFSDSLSRNHVPSNAPIQLDFSVDRITAGVAGSSLGTEFAAGQAAADIYTSTKSFVAPGAFVGSLTPSFGTYAGTLPAALGGGSSNTLKYDDSSFGLLAAGAVVGPGVAVPPPTPTPPGTIGRFDNIDAFDNGLFDANGDGLVDGDTYFTLYPDEAVLSGNSASDVFAVAAGDPSALPVPYAAAPTLGLDVFGGFGSDSIDALIMYDLGNLPMGLATGTPGMVDPGVDYALFSLSPGSAALMALTSAGIPADAGDIFFTDFTGLFATYATSADLGIISTPGGIPMQGSNVDGLDVTPAPSSVALLGLAGLAAGRRRR